MCIRDSVTPIGFGFLPGRLDMHWANVFAQDEIAVTPRLKATAGLKVEHNNYTGAEYLPSLRLAWTPDAHQLLWASLPGRKPNPIGVTSSQLWR